MPRIREKAIVLKTVEYKERDLIVTLLTARHGKVSALARSARASKRRFMGGIHLMDCATVELSEAKKRGSFLVLESLSEREHWQSLRTNLQAYVAACFCLEVVSELAVEDDSAAFQYFELLFRSIRAIDSAKDETDILCITNFCALKTIQLAGFDFVEQLPFSLETEAREWLTDMKQKDKPVRVQQAEHPINCLLAMATRIEEITDRALRTKRDVTALLAKSSVESAKRRINE